MRISELIARLKDIQDEDGDVLVVVSSDPEGNSFNALDETEGGRFYDEEDRELYDADDAPARGVVKVVVLWP